MAYKKIVRKRAPQPIVVRVVVQKSTGNTGNSKYRRKRRSR